MYAKANANANAYANADVDSLGDGAVVDFSILEGEHGWARRARRRGAYSSHLFDGGRGKRVALIMLDTRYHRDPHWLPSAGGLRWLPMGASLAALGRWVCTVLGLGADYDGDVLGEE